MAAFEPGEPRDPRVRTALEAMRVVAAGVLLVLIVHQVLTDGPLERLVFLTGAFGVVIGVDVWSRMARRGSP